MNYHCPCRGSLQVTDKFTSRSGEYQDFSMLDSDWLNKMVRPGGLELPTFWFVARRSIQLSYGRTVV